MLKAAAVQVHLTPEDVKEALLRYTAGRARQVEVQSEEGALVVRLKVAPEPVPLTLPVELRFAVLCAAGTTIELSVAWTNLQMVPVRLKEQVLRKAFEALPGRYEQGTYRVDAMQLLEYVPATFVLEQVSFNADGVDIAMSGVSVFPMPVTAVLEEPATDLVPAPSREGSDPGEHRSYYQKLRERVARFTRERAPEWSQPLLPWLLAGPDFFVLLVRLARDPRVPAGAKLLAGVSVAYFISPIDLLPDLIPVVGHVDDLGLALLAIEQVAMRVPEAVVQEMWPGDGKVLDMAREGSRLFGRVLPARLMAALRGRLVRR